MTSSPSPPESIPKENLIVGRNIQVKDGTTNSIILGHGVECNESDTIYIGNSSHTKVVIGDNLLVIEKAMCSACLNIKSVFGSPDCGVKLCWKCISKQ
jgi:hypothetical protein